MKTIYDAIVIGGGIYGTACSYFLKSSSNKILLIEKDKIGSSGATGFSRGITRVYDSDIELSKLSYDSLQYFLNWEKHKLPGKSPYQKSGFLYLMDEKDAEKATSFSNKMSTKEYPINVLYSNELNKKLPWLKNVTSKIGLYEPYGGYGNPTTTAVNFALGFKEKGGHVYENCKVEAIKKEHDDLWGVILPYGTVFCKTVIVTVGGFTKKLLPDLPIFTRSISLTQLTEQTRQVCLSLIDETIETYMRPGHGNSFYAGSQVFEIEDTPDLLAPSNGADVEDARQRLDQLINSEKKYQILNAMKGFDGYTKKKAPIVQFIESKKGLYVAAGFSGRGYKCCITIAQQISEEVQQYLNTQIPVNTIEWRYKLTI